MTAATPLGKVATSLAQKELDRFGESAPGVTSAVLLSSDGFEVAALKINQESASRLAAMGSSLAAVGSAIAQEAGINECRRLIVESDTGVVAVMTVPNVNPPLSLAVVADDVSVLGKLIWATKNCCLALEKRLSK